MIINVDIKSEVKQENETQFMCHICHMCDLKFDSLVMFQTHMLQKHPKPKKDITKPRRNRILNLKSQCEICRKSFTTMANLLAHKSKDHMIDAYECDKCDQKFRTKYKLSYHKNMNHSELSMHVINVVKFSLIEPI